MKNILLILLLVCVSNVCYSQTYESNLSEDQKKEMAMKFKLKRQELEKKQKEDAKSKENSSEKKKEANSKDVKGIKESN